MRVVVLQILASVCFIPSARPEISKLMQRLRDKSWPWFGDPYKTLCPKPQDEWVKCRNYRANNSDSILERIGLDLNFVPKETLKVVFSAPQEMVDVCGKLKEMSAVSPFILNANGYPITERLKQGAEIYRRRPSITWRAEPDVGYTLFFVDVGYFRIRGFYENVKAEGRILSGKQIWPYYPPGNPSTFKNPTLIVLLRRSEQDTTTNIDTIKPCTTDPPTKANILRCRDVLKTIITQRRLEALQVFYTDGSSMFDNYRACTDRMFCARSCVQEFKSYIEAQKSEIKFTDIDTSMIDTYVNLRFYSLHNVQVNVCCPPRNVYNFTYRPVPGDFLVVDNSAKAQVLPVLENKMLYEIAPSAETEDYFSVLMVDPDVPGLVYPDAKQFPYGHLWIANLKYPEFDSINGVYTAQTFAGPSPPDPSTHRYYILLYSHRYPVTAVPSGFSQHGGLCSSSRCKWDFSKLPSDFKLRGMSFFKATKDDFADVTLNIYFQNACGGSGSSVPGTVPGGPLPGDHPNGPPPEGLPPGAGGGGLPPGAGGGGLPPGAGGGGLPPGAGGGGLPPGGGSGSPYSCPGSQVEPPQRDPGVSVNLEVEGNPEQDPDPHPDPKGDTDENKKPVSPKKDTGSKNRASKYYVLNASIMCLSFVFQYGFS